jgi:hypothetical protein
LSKNVILLRRNPTDLRAWERQALKSRYGDDITFIRTDPKDHEEHARQCREYQPVAVLLPMERPIPSTAMEEGFAHVAFVPGTGGARLGRLEPLVPQFEFNF